LDIIFSKVVNNFIVLFIGIAVRHSVCIHPISSFLSSVTIFFSKLKININEVAINTNAITINLNAGAT
jgi:hypothetical protein